MNNTDTQKITEYLSQSETEIVLPPDYTDYVSDLFVCTDNGTPVSAGKNSFGYRMTWYVLKAPYDVSYGVLTEYRQKGLDLYFDGYLDFFHNIWACVVAKPGEWVEYAIVDGRNNKDLPKENASQESCLVTVTRLGESQIAESKRGAL